MTADMKGTIQQLIETLSTSRTKLTERLERWDILTASALVGEQWIICTPEGSCAYKLTPVAPRRYASECCSIDDAPLYGKEEGEKVLKYQIETRNGQNLVLMHIRDALVTDIGNVKRQEVLAKQALAKMEREGTQAVMA